MTLVFPGMDPYIEGQEWEDFHHHFVEEIHNALVPQLRPRYVVRVEKRIYVEHRFGEPAGGFRPDVVVVSDRSDKPYNRRSTTHGEGYLAPVVLSVPIPEEMREAFLTIRLRESMEVITVIEALSPANKRPGSDGRREYLSKRETVLRSGAHLVELDLLRGGDRLPTNEPLPAGDYYAFVCRASARPHVEVYAWSLRQRLPVIPIPLAGGDPDALLDLQAIFSGVYDRAGYDYSLQYQRPVTPPLSENDAAWAHSLLPSQ